MRTHPQPRIVPRPPPYAGDTPPPYARRERSAVRRPGRRAPRSCRRPTGRNRHPTPPRQAGSGCVPEWPDGSSRCRTASPRRARAKNRSAPYPTVPVRRRRGCSRRESRRKDRSRKAPTAAGCGDIRRAHRRRAPAGTRRRSARRAPPTRRRPHGRHRRQSFPPRSSPPRSP